MGRFKPGKIFILLRQYFSFTIRVITLRPDLVVIPISQSSLGFFKDSLYIIFSVLFKCRTILQLRGSNILQWYNNQNYFMKLYIRNVVGSAKGVIVLGEKLRKLFEDFFSEENIYVVYNGGNFDYNNAVKMNPYAQILYLSNLQKTKGIVEVINSLTSPIIAPLYEKIRLVVVGEWYDKLTKKKCEEIVFKSGLPVRFYPSADAEIKKEYFNKSDIFIFTPVAPEGHPWVIIEAMAAGLPIISSDQGAITESVIDGVNGFIVNPNNPEDIAKKLQLLIENKDLREKMGIESRRLYEEKFTEDIMADRLKYVFNSVLGVKS